MCHTAECGPNILNCWATLFSTPQPTPRSRASQQIEIFNVEALNSQPWTRVAGRIARTVKEAEAAVD